MTTATTACIACGKTGKHTKGCPNGITPVAGAATNGVADVAAPKKKKIRTAVEPPPLLEDPSLIVRLQQALNDRAITSVTQPLSNMRFCEAFRLSEYGTEVGCSEVAAFAHEDRNECPNCGKAKPTRDDLYCVAHTALKLAGLMINPQMALGEE